VRWSAIEVLTENKFTKASDVWSYGVLMFEVMSRGAQPYSEFATVAEVVEQIKGGYVLCP
jgi:serine/threonine protein kinase